MLLAEQPLYQLSYTPIEIICQRFSDAFIRPEDWSDSTAVIASYWLLDSKCTFLSDIACRLCIKFGLAAHDSCAVEEDGRIDLRHG